MEQILEIDLTNKHNLIDKYNENKVSHGLVEYIIKQAEELAKKIANISYDVIISSPLLRTMHTANIINCKNKNIITDERLKERDPGSLSGKPVEVTDREEYWNYYTNIKYGTEERIPGFFNRVKEFLDELKYKEYESVLIVAHSGVSKAFNGYFEGIGDGLFLHRGLQNCEIKEYEL